ncbi:MAG: plasmid mobilization relaxosome protein MobC [Gracilibacteraceae bacterium]|nr:plasmid mobilization relaxosome protein MobC [Gracilibacteraceae bacterium]
MERRTRKHEVHLRLNNEEYKALERNRAKCKLPQQTYLRKLVMNVQPIEHPPVEFFEVLRNLRQINNNLNQIALKANKNGLIDREAYYKNVDWLQKTISMLMQQYYRHTKG